MLKTYSYRLYPSEQQKQHFIRAFGCVRYIYNKGLEAKNKHYEQTGKTINYFSLATSWLGKEKKTNTWLQATCAQSLQMALRNLDVAFTRFFKKLSAFPQFKTRNDHRSIQYPQDVVVDFKRSKIRIPKAGWISCIFSRKFIGKIKTCTVSMTATGKFFVSILVDNELPLPAKPLIQPETAVGIDLGLKHFAILSTGERIENPKHLKNLLNRLKVLQRQAAHKQKGSNNRRKANRKVAVLHETIANRRTDFLQKLSSRLISENQTIVLEDLNVAGMLKNHRLAGSISDASWSNFVRMLEYKAEWYGKNIIKIGRFEPSSKLCSVCGWHNRDLTLKDRDWKCPSCNTQHDRDINAATNIKKFGLIKSPTGKELPEELVEIQSSAGEIVLSRKIDRRNKKLLASC